MKLESVILRGYEKRKRIREIKYEIDRAELAVESFKEELEDLYGSLFLRCNMCGTTALVCSLKAIGIKLFTQRTNEYEVAYYNFECSKTSCGHYKKNLIPTDLIPISSFQDIEYRLHGEYNIEDLHRDYPIRNSHITDAIEYYAEKVLPANSNQSKHEIENINKITDLHFGI